MRTNFHTHTQRCGHAGGSELDYIKSAISSNLTILGFSDHGPFPDDRHGLRMPYSELDPYLNELALLSTEYSDQITIKTGLEIEYDHREHAYYESLLEKMDYLILGQHCYITSDGSARNIYAASDTSEYILYANSIADAMKSGYFKLVAHPDLCFVNDFPWDDNCATACHIIASSSVQYNVPIEFNANGFRRGLTDFADGTRYQYPLNNFWNIASTYNPEVVINSDCHMPEQVWDYAMDLAHNITQYIGLRVIDTVF